MAELKPIETLYNGYRFRSRLEARWAVFFDCLDIEYRYEIEGFDLGDLGWYLPDFWLPNHKVWVEIKPNVNNRDEIDKEIHEKAKALRDGTGFPVILCFGAPKESHGIIHTYFKYQEHVFIYKNIQESGLECTFDDQLIIVGATNENIKICTKTGQILDEIVTLELASKIYGDDIDTIAKKEFYQHVESGVGKSWLAARKARQARFGTDERYADKYRVWNVM